MRSALFALLLLVAFPALCCTVPPQHILREHDALIAEATSIVLVEVAPGRTGSSRRFKVLRTWKAAVTQVPVACRVPSDGDWMTDFSAHSDKTFWQDRAGRLGISGDCTVISPAFSVGEKYLLFLGIAPDLKQFEQVSSAGDRWLQYVEKQFFKALK